jgi:hypothetical protein
VRAGVREAGKGKEEGMRRNETAITRKRKTQSKETISNKNAKLHVKPRFFL